MEKNLEVGSKYGFYCMYVLLIMMQGIGSKFVKNIPRYPFPRKLKYVALCCENFIKIKC